MVSFQPEELYSVGQQGADFHKGLATAVANTVCGLYQSSPKGFVTGTLADAPGALARGYWDSFCGRLPEPKLPEPPQQLFRGGQCPGVAYRVAGTIQIFRASDGVTQDNRAWSIQVRGPIRFIGTRVIGTPGNQSIAVIVEGQNVDGSVQIVNATDVAYPTFDMRSLVVSGVTRLDGLPDDCGDLPGDFPNQNRPAASNPGVYTHPSPGANPPRIPYSVDFDPTLIVPIIRIPIDATAEVEVTFDAGGINVDMPVNLGFGGDGGGISPEDLQALKDGALGIPELKDLLEDLTDTGKQSSNDKGEKTDGDEATEPGITGLVIQVTGFPPGYGRIFGQPQVYDFGRVHFKRGEFYSAPIRLVTVQQWVRADPDSDGYAIRLNPGVKANVTVIKQETE